MRPPTTPSDEAAFFVMISFTVTAMLHLLFCVQKQAAAANVPPVFVSAEGLSFPVAKAYVFVQWRQGR